MVNCVNCSELVADNFEVKLKIFSGLNESRGLPFEKKIEIALKRILKQNATVKQVGILCDS